MVRALERRRIAQSRLARALEDTVTLVRTVFLHAAHALIHPELALKRPAAVLQTLRLNFRRAAGGYQ
jgi:hypothetical protein